MQPTTAQAAAVDYLSYNLGCSLLSFLDLHSVEPGPQTCNQLSSTGSGWTGLLLVVPRAIGKVVLGVSVHQARTCSVDRSVNKVHVAVPEQHFGFACWLVDEKEIAVLSVERRRVTVLFEFGDIFECNIVKAHQIGFPGIGQCNCIHLCQQN